MRPDHKNPAALILTAGLALFAGPNPASAQYALGNGRALDNNLQWGSGGYNAAGRDFGSELAFRNAIVTGNVGGGREFRGSVGYTAADDFRGFLGSNTNYNFERDSFYSGLGTRNLVGIDAIRNPLAYTVAGQTDSVFGGPLIINRSGTAASAASAPPSQSNMTTDVYGNIAGTLRAPSVQITRADRMPEMLAYTGQPDSTGVTQIMSASPLMGIKALRSDSPSFSPGDPGNSDLTRMGLVQPGTGLPVIQGQTQEEQVPRSSPYQVVMESLRGPAEGQPFGAVPLGEPVGGPQVTTIAPPTLKDQASPLSTGTPVVPETPSDETGPPPDPSATPLSQSFDQGLDHLRAMLRTKGRPDRLEDANVVPGNDNNTPQAGEEEAASEESPDQAKRPKTAPELAAEILKGKSATIITLAEPVSEGTIFAQHMKRGQQMLAEERWFDAEERFTAALAVRPGDPIAAAARVNAQIAGGMFRSASVNLRNLFRAYPEMIVTRFDAALIGPAKRIDRVKAQLRERAAQDTQIAREATLLLAYLAFQTNDEATLAEAFARLDAIITDRKSQSEQLEQTVRAVWAVPPSASSPAPAP